MGRKMPEKPETDVKYESNEIIQNDSNEDVHTDLIEDKQNKLNDRIQLNQKKNVNYNSKEKLHTNDQDIQKNYTRSEQKQGKGVRSQIGGLIAVLVLLLFSVVIVQQGERIYKNIVGEQESTEIDYNQYLNEIIQTNYFLYHMYLEDIENKSLSVQEIYFPDVNKQGKYSKDAIQQREAVDQIVEMENMGNHLINYGAVKYMVPEMTNTGNSLYNSYGEFRECINEGKISDEVKSKYAVIFIQYLKNGEVKVLDCSGIDKELAIKTLEELSVSNIVNLSKQKVKNIENVYFFLGVNDSIKDAVDIYYTTHSNRQRLNQFVFERLAILAIIMIFAIIVLAILLMKVCHVGRSEGILSKIPLEITFSSIILLIYLYVGVSAVTFCYYESGWKEAIQNISKAIMIAQSSDTIKELICYFLWFLYFSITYLVIVVILQLFTKGIKRYVRENSLVVRFIIQCKKRICRFFDSFKKVDFKNPLTRTILKIVVLNTLIVAFISCFWFFGCGIAIIYGIVVFFWVNNYVAKAQKNYRLILDATKEMANGNLSVGIESEVGIFDSLREELLQVKEGFTEAVEREVKSQNMKNELITNVSHDLKTPLTAIITYLDLLKQDGLTEEEQQEYIQILDQKSTRLKQLIEDLFEVSKLNSNNVQLEISEVDIVQLIKQAIIEFGDRFRDAGIEMVTKVPEESILLNLDGQKMYRVFSNLYENTLKYGLSNTRAYTHIEHNGQEVIITLRNISQYELPMDGEQLMERFVRGDVSRNTEGSGLGLAIVKSIVEKQGGRLSIITDGDLFKVVIELSVED